MFQHGCEVEILNEASGKRPPPIGSFDQNAGGLNDADGSFRQLQKVLIPLTPLWEHEMWGC